MNLMRCNQDASRKDRFGCNPAILPHVRIIVACAKPALQAADLTCRNTALPPEETVRHGGE
jgi:hypothetical protein